MLDSLRFPFTEGYDAFGMADAIPQLPLTLTYRDTTLQVSGLLDTGTKTCKFLEDFSGE